MFWDVRECFLDVLSCLFASYSGILIRVSRVRDLYLERSTY